MSVTRLALLAMIVPAACAAQPVFQLVRDGLSDVSIRTTGDSDVERLAAAELAKYIALTTGAQLPITHRSSAREVLLRAGSGDGVDTGYTIDVSTARVRIFGTCPVGVLYGVYDFLQTYLGCRWYAGGDIGESLPALQNVSIPTGTRAEAPDFAFRTFFLRREEEMWWALRNRINGFFTAQFVTSLGSGTRRSLLYLASGQGGIHAWYSIVPAEKYYDRHPEYFALVNGKRVRGNLRGGQICTTHPEVIDLVAKTARDYFLANPDARVFSIAPNDGYGWCECDNCRALDEQLGGARTWRDGRAPVVTDRLVTFANQVAEKALRDLPGRELFIFSYVNYIVPPQVAVPQEGVTVWVCHYAPACYAHPIRDPGCPENAQFLEHLTTWAQWPRRLGIYAYTDKSMWEGLPRPVVRQMMDDIDLFHSLGIPRYVAQSSASAWGQMGALYWLTAQKLWDADMDLEAAVDDWYGGFFAEAAQPMRAFVERLERSVAESGEHYSCFPRTEGPRAFSQQALADARGCLARATAAAREGKVKDRVAKTADSFEFGARYLGFALAYSRYNDTGDRGALLATMEVAKLLAADGGRRGAEFSALLETLRREAETGFAWVGFATEEQLGGRRAWNSDETGVGDNASGWATLETVVQDTKAPYTLTLTVWGKSAGFTPVLCSKGKGAGYNSGGVWTPLPLTAGRLSGKEQWDELVYRIAPEMFDPESLKQRIGFGGGDSQIWLSDVGLEAEG